MLQFPESTAFNKRIPKQKFYDNMPVTPEVKHIFTEQIRLIYWRNKLAPVTMNVAAGKNVAEIQVFELQLNQLGLEEAVLRQIDKAIPYHILYLLRYENQVQARICYKEQSGTAAKVGSYYHTEWMDEQALSLTLDGLDMDAVYQGLVRQIAGNALAAPTGESLKTSVERDVQRQKLEKQIAALQTKLRREKQLNRQVELNAQLKKLRKELVQL